MNEQEFIQSLKNINIELTKQQLQQLNDYYKILVEANKKINLTRIIKKEEVYIKHFYDSLTIQNITNLQKPMTLCDVGSGAGFPGIVLKICFPQLKITLIDSLNKRVQFLKYVINKLALKNIEAYHLRAEELVKTNTTFDLVVARAVAALPKLLPLCMDLVNEKGSFVAMKAKVEEELHETKKIMLKNNWILCNKCEFTLPNDNGIRTLLEFKHKTTKTSGAKLKSML